MKDFVEKGWRRNVILALSEPVALYYVKVAPKSLRKLLANPEKGNLKEAPGKALTGMW